MKRTARNALCPFGGGAACAFAGDGGICCAGSRVNVCAFVSANCRDQRGEIQRQCYRLGRGHERWHAGSGYFRLISAGQRSRGHKAETRHCPAVSCWSRALFTCSTKIKISRSVWAKRIKRWFSDPLRWMNASSIVRLTLSNHPFDNSAVCLDSTI